MTQTAVYRFLLFTLLFAHQKGGRASSRNAWEATVKVCKPATTPACLHGLGRPLSVVFKIKKQALAPSGWWRGSAWGVGRAMRVLKKTRAGGLQ